MKYISIVVNVIFIQPMSIIEFVDRLIDIVNLGYWRFNILMVSLAPLSGGDADIRLSAERPAHYGGQLKGHGPSTMGHAVLKVSVYILPRSELVPLIYLTPTINNGLFLALPDCQDLLGQAQRRGLTITCGSRLPGCRELVPNERRHQLNTVAHEVSHGSN
jgi:hypothetical protein